MVLIAALKPEPVIRPSFWNESFEKPVSWWVNYEFDWVMPRHKKNLIQYKIVLGKNGSDAAM